MGLAKTPSFFGKLLAQYETLLLRYFPYPQLGIFRGRLTENRCQLTHRKHFNGLDLTVAHHVDEAGQQSQMCAFVQDR